MPSSAFLAAFDRLTDGYSEGHYDGLRFGVIVRRSGEGHRNSLLARNLAGTDSVSFNLYRLRSGEVSLKPCEMPSEKVIAFLLGFRPDMATPADGSAG